MVGVQVSHRSQVVPCSRTLSPGSCLQDDQPPDLVLEDDLGLDLQHHRGLRGYPPKHREYQSHQKRSILLVFCRLQGVLNRREIIHALQTVLHLNMKYLSDVQIPRTYNNLIYSILLGVQASFVFYVSTLYEQLQLQGYPQRMRLVRRLHGINTAFFLYLC